MIGILKSPIPKYFLMMLRQIGQQKLERQQEPDQISDGEEQTMQYHSVRVTKLMVAYAVGIETLHRCLVDNPKRSAIDLACGPAVMTALTAKYLNVFSMEGRDLSDNMLKRAEETRNEMGLSKVMHFKKGDIRDLSDIPEHSLHFSTFSDAAHHMPTVQDVQKVLKEMDRVTRVDGVVFAMDLVRLRTEKMTESYVSTVGADYLEKGLPRFLADFRYSMYAAWTKNELRQAVPQSSTRDWYHVVPRFLPAVQFIIGVPKGRDLFVKDGMPWAENDNPVPAEMLSDWKLARMTLKFADVRLIQS